MNMNIDTKIKQTIFEKLSKIGKKFNNHKCDKLIYYLTMKINKYDLKNNTDEKYDISEYSAKDCFPSEIVNIIFGKIPIEERKIDFFRTNKYYYNFSHIFYDNYRCVFSDKYEYIMRIDANISSKIEILDGAMDCNFINHTSSLRELTFNTNFNKPIDNLVLPKSLEILEFRREFNQPINNLVLPKYLKQLTFGYKFNQPVSNLSLPES